MSYKFWLTPVIGAPEKTYGWIVAEDLKSAFTSFTLYGFPSQVRLDGTEDDCLRYAKLLVRSDLVHKKMPSDFQFTTIHEKVAHFLNSYIYVKYILKDDHGKLRSINPTDQVS